MERAGEKSDADADDDDDDDNAGDVDEDDLDDGVEKSVGDGDGCGDVGFRNFYRYSRHLLGPWDDSVEDVTMKWVRFE